MNDSPETVFQKAWVSTNSDAVLNVAECFDRMGYSLWANALRNRFTVGFGANGTSRSVSDLEDIVAAKDVEMQNLDKMVGEVSTMNVPFDMTAIGSAVEALKTRYTAARTKAQSTIDNAASILHLMPKAFTDATTEYNAILSAMNPRWQEGTWSAGDGSIEDINAQLTTMGATGKENAPIPQPVALDPGLELLKATTVVTDVAEGAAGGVGKLTGKAASGLAGSIDTSTILKIGLIAGVGLVILFKVMNMSPQAALVRRFV